MFRPSFLFLQHQSYCQTYSQNNSITWNGIFLVSTGFSFFQIDSHFMVDGSKFLSASTAALSVMVNLEIPHVNVLSKIDLLSNSAK